MGTFGSTAPSQQTVNYDALLSTTLYNYKGQLADNIFKSSSFLAALRKFGGVRMVNGGERIAIPLMYETSSTAKSYSGYEVIDVTPQDGITTAFYPWTEIAASIAISRKEERQNNGESALLNLLESKTMQAEMSLKQAVNQQLVQGTVGSATGAKFRPGNDGKDLAPLGYFTPRTKTVEPTGTGITSVGSINRNTYSWWRCRTMSLGDATTPGYGEDGFLNATTFSGVKQGLKRLWNHCSRGADGSGPNIVLTDQTTYETYESALDANVRYTDTNLADLGFDNVKLKGAVVVWDELVPDIQSETVALTYGTAFMVNTKYYQLCIDSATDFTTTEFVTPENQTAKVAKVLFMGQSTCSNMRKIGVGYKIALTITS